MRQNCKLKPHPNPSRNEGAILHPTNADVIRISFSPEEKKLMKKLKKSSLSRNKSGKPQLGKKTQRSALRQHKIIAIETYVKKTQILILTLSTSSPEESTTLTERLRIMASQKLVVADLSR